MNNTVSTAVQFASVTPDGKLQGFVSYAYPPHELGPNDFPLTKSEVWLLKALSDKNIQLTEAAKLLRSINRKIKKVQK